MQVQQSKYDVHRFPINLSCAHYFFLIPLVELARTLAAARLHVGGALLVQFVRTLEHGPNFLLRRPARAPVERDVREGRGLRKGSDIHPLIDTLQSPPPSPLFSTTYVPPAHAAFPVHQKDVAHHAVVDAHPLPDLLRGPEAQETLPVPLPLDVALLPVEQEELEQLWKRWIGKKRQCEKHFQVHDAFFIPRLTLSQVLSSKETCNTFMAGSRANSSWKGLIQSGRTRKPESRKDKATSET